MKRYLDEILEGHPLAIAGFNNACGARDVLVGDRATDGSTTNTEDEYLVCPFTPLNRGKLDTSAFMKTVPPAQSLASAQVDPVAQAVDFE